MELGSMVSALRGIKTVIDIAKKNSLKDESNKENLVKLYKSLKIAVSETRTFIETNNGNHIRNLTLQKLWLDAFECAHKPYLRSDKKFPSWLNSKAEFWADPKSWLQEPGCMKMVPTLKEIELKIEELKGPLGL